MRFSRKIASVVLIFTCSWLSPALAAQLNWAGETWNIRAGTGSPCAASTWNPNGAWVDAAGRLHLRLQRMPNGQFACVEIETVRRMSFGQYNFDVSGPIGAIDPNVVLGMFLYPPKDVGKDGTNEIDIEIARWGNANAAPINYTAWYRSHKGNRHTSIDVAPTLDHAIFNLNWQPDSVTWTSDIAKSKPVGFQGDLALKPQKLMINLWLFRQSAPSDGREEEFVIRSMRRP